jgi:methionyl-tRNA formyltransferase
MIENRISSIGKVIFIRNSNPIVVCGSGLLMITAMHAESGVSLMSKIKFRTRFL